jgi:hypothetical protein
MLPLQRPAENFASAYSRKFTAARHLTLPHGYSVKRVCAGKGSISHRWTRSGGPVPAGFAGGDFLRRLPAGALALRVIAVVMGVQLGRFGGVMAGMGAMAGSGMGVMGRRFRLVFFIVLGGFAMMMRGLFMMLGGVVMMLAGGVLVRHRRFPLAYAHTQMAGRLNQTPGSRK